MNKIVYYYHIVEYIALSLIKFSIVGICLYESLEFLIFMIEYMYRYSEFCNRFMIYGIVQVVTLLLHIFGHFTTIFIDPRQLNIVARCVLIVTALCGPFSFLLVVARICVWNIFHRPLFSWMPSEESFQQLKIIFFAIGVLIQLLYSGHTNLMHDFYRRKLLNALYWKKLDLKFSKVPIEAPFVICNASLNNVGESYYSDFMLSPVFYGSSKTNYSITSKLLADSYLSCAMAVSGAALPRNDISSVWTFSNAMLQTGLGKWIPLRNGIYTSGRVFAFLFLSINLIFLYGPTLCFMALFWVKHNPDLQKYLFWGAVSLLVLGYGFSLLDLPISHMLMFNPIVRFLHQLFAVRYKRNKASRDKSPYIWEKRASQTSSSKNKSASIDIPYVFVTDGAHFENLGAYELLRRRCQLIVVSDVGEDEDRKLDDFQSLLEKAKEHLNCSFEVDPGFSLEDIQKRVYVDGSLHENRLKQTNKRFIRLTIYYYDKDDKNRSRIIRTGKMWYLKPTLIGNEELEIQLYAAKDSTFPHMPTTKQIVNTAFYKAYKRLGERTMYDMVDDIRKYLSCKIEEFEPDKVISRMNPLNHIPPQDNMESKARRRVNRAFSVVQSYHNTDNINNL